MNLLTDAWIPVQTRSGEARRIPLVEMADPGVLDIAAPRPDFTAALYQCCIGLLQCAYAPKDFREWRERYGTLPTREQLSDVFAVWQAGFELDNETGPAFFQDLDPLRDGEPVEIAKLLIDTPGDKTIENNNDLFQHASTVERMCPACAAAALLTLQVNAPSGGAGHRVSLRGGGPLTTLRIPRDATAPLWQRLWSNVVPAEVLQREPHSKPADVMPWLGKTRTSDRKKQGVGTTHEDAHPYQSYWSMPRRIRLDWQATEAGVCDVCGEASERCVRQYRTRPYGVDYLGAWRHSLTPYVLDAKQADLPISIKGQRGGVGYRHWLGLAVGEENGPAKAATVVAYFNRQWQTLPPDQRDARLWCSGYDMDNMKSRCWYDATLPLPDVDASDLPELTETVRKVLDCAGEMAALVRKQTGIALHPDGTGDPALSQSFWQSTETDFYHFLQKAMAGIAEPATVGEAAQQWLVAARRRGLEVFDAHVLTVPIELGKMQDVVDARTGLERAFFSGKSKALWMWANDQKEDAA